MITYPLRFKKFSLEGLLTVLYYLGVIAIFVNLARLYMYSGSIFQRIVRQGTTHELLIQTLTFACGVIICWTIRHWFLNKRSRSSKDLRSELADLKKEVAEIKEET